MQKKDGKVIKSKQIDKSRLTDALIDRLHNYFGIALRSNAKSELKPELKHALLASMFHIASSQGENYHTYILPQNLAGAISQRLYKPKFIQTSAWYSKCYKRKRPFIKI